MEPPVSHDRTRPAAVMLDLLRSADGHENSAQALIRYGAVFGFPENRIRVTLSRLLARGLIESPERGRYRLAAQGDRLHAFVERWRLGEARVRPWQPGRWLFAHPQGEVAGSHWALDALGFREVRNGLWSRPDNLSCDQAALEELGAGIGLAPDVLIFPGRPQDVAAAAWLRSWHPTALEEAYVDLRERLDSSARQLEQLTLAEAMLKSFTLGGEVVHRLAKDPLLPAELIDVTERARLSAAMLDYDALGRRVWAHAGEDAPLATPRPQLVQAG
ncbi:MAG: hypothetical protein EA417_18095 [Gammaproteobacteria bacterium]|nr:MAG: hypothetical protein EA417_18095 [Gammaproteobacteria bacterium]